MLNWTSIFSIVLMMGCLFNPGIESRRLFDHLSVQVMMRTVGRLAQLDDQSFFLGRVIVRFLVEANPQYIRDVIAVLCLEHSRPVATPRVTRTPTTESSWRTTRTERLNHPPDPTRIQMMMKASNIFIASC